MIFLYKYLNTFKIDQHKIFFNLCAASKKTKNYFNKIQQHNSDSEEEVINTNTNRENIKHFLDKKPMLQTGIKNILEKNIEKFFNITGMVQACNSADSMLTVAIALQFVLSDLKCIVDDNSSSISRGTKYSEIQRKYYRENTNSKKNITSLIQFGNTRFKGNNDLKHILDNLSQNDQPFMSHEVFDKNTPTGAICSEAVKNTLDQISTLRHVSNEDRDNCRSFPDIIDEAKKLSATIASTITKIQVCKEYAILAVNRLKTYIKRIKDIKDEVLQNEYIDLINDYIKQKFYNDDVNDRQENVINEILVADMYLIMISSSFGVCLDKYIYMLEDFVKTYQETHYNLTQENMIVKYIRNTISTQLSTLILNITKKIWQKQDIESNATTDLIDYYCTRKNDYLQPCIYNKHTKRKGGHILLQVKNSPETLKASQFSHIDIYKYIKTHMFSIIDNLVNTDINVNINPTHLGKNENSIEFKYKNVSSMLKKANIDSTKKMFNQEVFQVIANPDISHNHDKIQKNTLKFLKDQKNQVSLRSKYLNLNNQNARMLLSFTTYLTRKLIPDTVPLNLTHQAEKKKKIFDSQVMESQINNISSTVIKSVLAKCTAKRTTCYKSGKSLFHNNIEKNENNFNTLIKDDVKKYSSFLHGEYSKSVITEIENQNKKLINNQSDCNNDIYQTEMGVKNICDMLNNFLFSMVPDISYLLSREDSKTFYLMILSQVLHCDTMYLSNPLKDANSADNLEKLGRFQKELWEVLIFLNTVKISKNFDEEYKNCILFSDINNTSLESTIKNFHIRLLKIFETICLYANKDIKIFNEESFLDNMHKCDDVSRNLRKCDEFSVLFGMFIHINHGYQKLLYNDFIGDTHTLKSTIYNNIIINTLNTLKDQTKVPSEQPVEHVPMQVPIKSLYFVNEKCKKDDYKTRILSHVTNNMYHSHIGCEELGLPVTIDIIPMEDQKQVSNIDNHQHINKKYNIGKQSTKQQIFTKRQNTTRDTRKEESKSEEDTINKRKRAREESVSMLMKNSKLNQKRTYKRIKRNNHSNDEYSPSVDNNESFSSENSADISVINDSLPSAAISAALSSPRQRKSTLRSGNINKD